MSYIVICYLYPLSLQGKSVVTEYPVFGQIFIGLLLVSSVSCVPLTALYVYCRRRNLRGTHHKRQRHVSAASALWPDDDLYSCPLAEHSNSTWLSSIKCHIEYLCFIIHLNIIFLKHPCRNISFLQRMLLQEGISKNIQMKISVEVKLLSQIVIRSKELNISQD